MVNAAEKAFKEKDIVSAKPLLQEAEWALKDVNHWEKQKNNFVKRQEDFTGYFNKKTELETGQIKRNKLYDYRFDLRSGGSQYYLTEANWSRKHSKQIANLPIDPTLPYIALPDVPYDLRSIPTTTSRVPEGALPYGELGYTRIKLTPMTGPDSSKVIADAMDANAIASAANYHIPSLELPSMKKVDKVFGGITPTPVDYTQQTNFNDNIAELLNKRSEERAREILNDYHDRINEEKMNVEFLPTRFGGKTLTVY